MMSWQLRGFSWFSRQFVKRWLASVRGIPDLRDGFERHARRSHISPPLADYRNGHIGNKPVKWVSCGPVKNRDTLIYIHGGGYVAGSPETHQHLVAHLCQALESEAVMPRYRLAPENPFPAAIEDIIACYHGLVAQGRDSARFIIGGDSAGGGLVFSLLAYLAKSGLPKPLCAFALSPVVDFTHAGDSIKTNADSEAVLVSARIAEMDQMYLNGADPADPEVSPLFADFPNCPPVLMHVADQEILRDDTLAMQNHLLEQGADVLVRSWAGGFHVWHMLVGYVPEARAALKDVADFIKAQR